MPQGYRNVVFRNVDAYAEAFLIDIREVFLGFFGVFVGDIQVHMLVAALLHLVVDARATMSRGRVKDAGRTSA